MQYSTYIAILATLLRLTASQKVGTYTTETHPSLSSSKCTSSGCTTQSTKVVLDSNWRWLHTTAANQYTNCYTGSAWNTALCPDPTTCATNCALDGADYTGVYGIASTGTELTLKFVTTGTNKNVGSRVYLMENDTKYQMINPLGGEFTFDVDVSNLPCGLNGALYFSGMDADGGAAKYPSNTAGAKYGTGYCDAQCPHDIKFINGEANTLDWTPSSTDANAGSGRYGTCCDEMDIWEANSMATAYTPHPCTSTGQTRCSGTECGDGDNRYGGICDKDGCDFNSYRMGNTGFYGIGKTINTSQKFTVITQFITSDGTANGDLIEIKRKYKQNGVVYENSASTISTVSGNSITDAFCAAQKTAFGDTNDFATKGKLKKMGAAFKNNGGMVLSMSIWDDHAAHMLWLDSSYPLDKSSSTPGVKRGECATTTGVPSEIEASAPNSSVKFSNIKWGALNTTY
ncbi:uncharacterized protein LAJ45_03003 [Morchella importuna]|uniref:uncharacterized protein n=1 Tax=Morchella importuna TaxID=1174673 RepID=UPI001E8CC71F|nr:uncharacterized protein LAJ45_03003 [Morchella importuna]KAH8152778.1 hypothetical protein LAJ45_03003 [Morchella importuna]